MQNERKPKLFAKKFGIEIALERLLKHIANGQEGLLIHDDPVFVDLLNLVEIDDVRAVDTHEISRQPFL